MGLDEYCLAVHVYCLPVAVAVMEREAAPAMPNSSPARLTAGEQQEGEEGQVYSLAWRRGCRRAESMHACSCMLPFARRVQRRACLQPYI